MSAAGHPAQPPLVMALTGGGSGGHVNPALAVAEALQSHGPVHLFYVGTAHGIEADLVPRAGIAFHAIHAAALLKPGPVPKARGAWHTLWGTLEAWRLLRRERPAVVFATGGYVAGPVGVAASWLGIPLVLYEPNVWPGLTNRLLARRATVVVTSHADTARHLPPGTPIQVVGYPVRAAVRAEDRGAARNKLGLPPDAVVVVATGGSQGAPAINTLMAGVWARALSHPQWCVIWATGPRRYDAAVASISPDAAPERLRVSAYLYDMEVALAAADVVVGRAGAGTLAEAAARGVPMVMVPSPHVSEHHQERNAALWQEHGAGVAVAEGEVATTGVEAVVALMADRERRAAMGERARQFYRPDAVDRIAAAVLGAAGGGLRRRR
jgi:UDP-N-acetylglucosamine--N-acetylmuramyl-(pentapeptide) pyrophosphoryl-undecaprenol N-acetylglucosamine transferase